MTIKRYNPNPRLIAPSTETRMVEDEDGEYVRVQDLIDLLGNPQVNEYQRSHSRLLAVERTGSSVTDGVVYEYYRTKDDRIMLRTYGNGGSDIKYVEKVGDK